tara:strand:- start:2238 stop:2876 length:639 start_codon:yes stop_codon:yes gene_type:complete
MALIQLRLGSDYYHASPLLKEAMDAAAKEQGRDKKAVFIKVLNDCRTQLKAYERDNEVARSENRELKETVALFETDPEMVDIANAARAEKDCAKVKEENERLMERCRVLIKEAKANEDYIQKIEGQLKEAKEGSKESKELMQKAMDNYANIRERAKVMEASLKECNERIAELTALLEEKESVPPPSPELELELNRMREERIVLKHVLSKFLA